MARKQKASPPGNGSNRSSDSPTPAEQASADIIPANLRALETIYFTAMLEEAHLFEVVDTLAALFSRGALPLGPGRAGAILYRHWKGQPGRLTMEQRHTVYARAFGLPGGDAGVTPNRDFTDLWLRFVSIVGMYSAELQSLPPAQRSVNAEEVLISGRTLALNLSTHGHGLAWFAAKDFKPEIQQLLELLSDTELQGVLEARDPWQVIESVAASELGARPNVPRARARAESGVIIIRWLSNRRARLLRPRSANILKHEDICEGRTAASLNKKATVYPTDSDLVTACEQWLGVTGTQEAELKDESQLEAPPTPEISIPEEEEEQQDQAGAVIGEAELPEESTV